MWWPKKTYFWKPLQGTLTRTGDNGLLLDTAVQLLRPDGFSQRSDFCLIASRKVQNWLKSCCVLVVCCISVFSCQWLIHANAWPCVAHVINAWKINHRYLSICSSLSSNNHRCSQSTLFCTQDFRSSEGMAMAGIGGIAGAGGLERRRLKEAEVEAGRQGRRISRPHSCCLCENIKGRASLRSAGASVWWRLRETQPVNDVQEGSSGFGGSLQRERRGMWLNVAAAFLYLFIY